MKKYIVYLPIFLLFLATSCSEEASSEAPEEQADDAPKKALEEREPEVKEYLDAVDELATEYFVLAEGLLDTYDKMQKGEMDAFEKLAMVAEMSTAALEIERLSGEIASIETQQEGIEAKLDADDIIELGMKVQEKMVRYNEVMKRVGEIDFSEFSDFSDMSDFESYF
jgi:hypothetical protein